MVGGLVDGGVGDGWFHAARQYSRVQETIGLLVGGCSATWCCLDEVLDLASGICRAETLTRNRASRSDRHPATSNDSKMKCI